MLKSLRTGTILSMKRLLLPVLVLCAACTGQTSGQGGANAPTAAPLMTGPAMATSTERPLAAESNPPGDIPDTQAFVTYVSPVGGYKFDAPEGWARSVRGPNVVFADKFDGVSVTLVRPAAGAHAPNPTQAAIANLESGARAGRDFRVTPARLPGGPAVIVMFTSNSDADAVTGKRVRLADEAVVFQAGSRTATLLLWAPLGSDNADQWRRIASSFRWR